MTATAGDDSIAHFFGNAQAQMLIDGASFARRSEAVSGELSLPDLSRLSDILFVAAGDVTYTLAGSAGDSDEPLLRLRIRGRVPLQCQRCMNRLDHELEIDVLFELLRGDVELTQEEIEDDSRDYLPADAPIDVIGLVEDEILLALPTAPRHADCALSVPREAGEPTSRFGGLAALKEKLH